MSEDTLHNHVHDRLRTDAKESDETYQRAAKLFKALADPERLKLLAILANGEACVSELASIDQMSAVSQRLKLLRMENLVSNKRDGKHMIYQLADHHVFELIENAIAHVKE
jgi:ArsR family transcriptional regulator